MIHGQSRQIFEGNMLVVNWMRERLFLIVTAAILVGAGAGALGEEASPLDTVLDAGDRSLMRRQAAVGELEWRLTDKEFEALSAFLGRSDLEDALPPDQLNALKNEVINVLKNQPRRDPNPLIAHLMALYAAPEQDGVLRDYCIQHLGTMYPGTSSSNREALNRLLWEAVGRKHGPTAGTALIALANNIGADISPASVADQAIAISGDGSYSDAARTTAIQIAARLGDTRTVSLAREIAFERGAVPLRVSAIAAVGALGNEHDLPQLQPLADSTEIRLRTAASAAIRRIEQRLGE